MAMAAACAAVSWPQSREAALDPRPAPIKKDVSAHILALNDFIMILKEHQVLQDNNTCTQLAALVHTFEYPTTELRHPRRPM